MRIDLFLHQQGLDTTTPAGKALFQMMGVFAEFERAMIQERIRAGLARARAEGTKSGKPIGRPSIPASTERAITKALQKGLGISQGSQEPWRGRRDGSACQGYYEVGSCVGASRSLRQASPRNEVCELAAIAAWIAFQGLVK